MISLALPELKDLYAQDPVLAVAPQLSVVSIKCLKLWAKSEAHPKMSYIGNTPRNPVFIEDFSDECLVAV